ncbi:MAG: phage shock protein operon transcriptional activator [Marinobacterium sp.]|nr:phage shock protein operon transcriptional activator [Marinobacterium sp.]
MKLNKTLIGESPQLMDLMERLSRLATLNKPVLVLGERGTGKELIAERIHFLSPRWDQPFIKLNCAAMSETLLESELFGHEKGAFTGATAQHKGRFERADGGTLFLDELATCSQRVQEKLLRVIEYGELERLGGQQTLQVDVRLVAATNENIATMAETGAFRADLLDRLAFDVLHLPPLRYREGDVQLLAEHFAIAMCIELQRPFFAGFTPHALTQLDSYHWPGNIRELKNVVERSIYRSEDPEAEIDQIILNPFTPPWQMMNIPSSPTHRQMSDKPNMPATEQTEEPPQPGQATFATKPASKGSLAAQVARLEQLLIIEALQRHHYNQRDSAEALGLSYHQLRAQLKKHGMLPLRRWRMAQPQ